MYSLLDRSRAKVFLVLIFCFLWSGLFSQVSDVNSTFRHLSVKNDLSQNTVMAIFKDSRDFMWFGTRDGLNLYDGYQFKVFRHSGQDGSSISDNYIRAIVEDDKGTLWIGTESGLNAYDSQSGKFTVYKNRLEDSTSISHNKIFSILNTSEGDLWIGTENGLNLKRKGSDSFVQYYHTPNNPNSLSGDHITTLYEDSKGGIWIGTQSEGLNKFDGTKNGFERFIHDSNNPNSLRSNRISCLAEDGEGSIWIGTIDGLDILTKEGEFKHYGDDMQRGNGLSNTMVRSLIFDKQGNLWIGTYDGLNYLDIKTGRFKVYRNIEGEAYSISHNSIRSLYLDPHGFLWAGTYFGGINILDPTTSQFTYYHHNPTEPQSLGYNVVGSMVEDQKGNIWVGTEGGGLYYFDYKQKSFSKITEFNGVPIRTKTIKSMLMDSMGNLWVGTHLDGLWVINLESGKIKVIRHQRDNPNSIWDDSVISLLEDFNGKIWIGTISGLNIFDPEKEQMSRLNFLDEDSSENNSVITLFEASDHTVWIGTRTKGLIHYDKGRINRYVNNDSDSTSISQNSIYSIYEDHKKRLWVGTYGGGLNLFDSRSQTFQKFGVEEGLVNDIVYGIEEDGNRNLWISAPSGISRFDPEHQIFKNYTPNNGLPIEEFNERSSLMHSDGSIFLGGVNGLLSFRPLEIKNNPIMPKLVFNELKLFNKTISPNEDNGILKHALNRTDLIEFSNKDNVFTIEYTAFNYPQLDANQYAYMLNGFEDDWNYVGDKRSATYTNLDPGNYTFKVRVANGDGVWNPDIRSINIIKLPPFWKTIWAYMLYALTAVMIFLLVRRYLLIKLRLENKLKLEKLEKKEMKKLFKLKLNFFTNISHDFRTPLTLIHGPLQELIVKSVNTPAHGQLQLIKRNVNLMLRLIDQLLDFRKLENEKMPLKLVNEPFLPFIKEIVFSFQELAKIQSIEFVFTSRYADKKVLYDRNKIEMVLYNLLSNAFKYTPEGGRITVEVGSSLETDSNRATDEMNEYVEVAIKNTGPGIERENLVKIFDRFYQGKNQEKYSQPGAGIGLSLAKGLMKLHKGYIKVESTPNEITEFAIGIPLKDVYKDSDKLLGMEHSADQLFARDAIPVKGNKVGSKEHDVLIVEDNYDLCDFLERVFEDTYTVRKAKNGEEALYKIQEFQPSIIISDIMMPKMSGIELCKKLKTDPRTNHIPIILLTARSSGSIELDGYDVGAEDFISKPFNVEVLKSKVKNLIRSKDRIKERSRKEVLLAEEMVDNNSSDEKFLKKLSDYIRDNIDDPNLNVAKTSMDFGISRVHLYRKVKAITGKTPVEFIRDFRLAVAGKLLEQEDCNINEICYRVGFQDVSYFRKCFKTKFGMPATKYSDQMKTERINDLIG